MKCKTLYVSPRPDKKSFNNYYTDSASSKFWATTFYKATQKNRREMLWKPKAELINNKISKYAFSTEIIIDIGGGYGVFMEEFLKLNSMNHLVIEPSKYLSEVCRDKKLNVLEKFLEDIDKDDLNYRNKTFVSFELFEHLLANVVPDKNAYKKLVGSILKSRANAKLDKSTILRQGLISRATA